jgi:N-methylhydantoinase B
VGRWRGGLGVETEIELLVDTVIGVRGDRMLVPPPGAQGGGSGAPGGWTLRRGDGTVEHLAHRPAGIEAHAGDVFVLRSSGGGGLGPASERSADQVLADVRDGNVSPEGAVRDYGVEPEAAR